MNANMIFDFLWNDYVKEAPQATKVKELFENYGEEVVNDHIAFRTFNHPAISKEELAKTFLNLGYEYAGQYHFADKKLNAVHLAHPTQQLPKVFISELLLEEFSIDLQKTIQTEVIDQIADKLVAADNLALAGRAWALPSYEVYQNLRTESEYAAWTYVYGFRANHFTVSVNHLKKLNTIEEVNTFLKNNGYLLNNSGGEVKGSTAVCLKQSSTIAEMRMLPFQEGVYEVPSCFYEFAERFNKEDGTLFEGFIADNANKIFESTDLALQEDIVVA